VPPARSDEPDDPTELAQRVARLHEQITGRTDPAGPLGDTAQARREQLNRWHTDDTIAAPGRCAVGRCAVGRCAVGRCAVGEHVDSDAAGWAR
jgi:hypothetical protein